MKIVIASGFFDPIHKGHVEYLNKARELGDWLIVLLNNDKQAVLKKGNSFMSESERKIILENIKSVNEVIVSIDEDKSVKRTLAAIHKNLSPANQLIFVNGGDVKAGCREEELCKELDIQCVYGLGEKIQSSSNLLK